MEDWYFGVIEIYYGFSVLKKVQLFKYLFETKIFDSLFYILRAELQLEFFDTLRYLT
jgi:hypothetical protein